MFFELAISRETYRRCFMTKMVNLWLLIGYRLNYLLILFYILFCSTLSVSTVSWLRLNTIHTHNQTVTTICHRICSVRESSRRQVRMCHYHFIKILNRGVIVSNIHCKICVQIYNLQMNYNCQKNGPFWIIYETLPLMNREICESKLNCNWVFE